MYAGASEWLHVFVSLTFLSWLLCRLGSEHCSASWQSQTQSQWPLEQCSVLEPRRPLASVRWTPGTDPLPCPLDDMSPSGSVCWTTQRSSLTSRWVVKAFLPRRDSWYWRQVGAHHYCAVAKKHFRFHHSSSSLVTGWHGNWMILSCWMHGWNCMDLFSNVRFLPVYCSNIYSQLPILASCLKPVLLLSCITRNFFLSHLTTLQDILWKPWTPWGFTVLSRIALLMTCGNPHAFSDNVVKAGRYTKETTIQFLCFWKRRASIWIPFRIYRINYLFHNYLYLDILV